MRRVAKLEPALKEKNYRADEAVSWSRQPYPQSPYRFPRAAGLLHLFLRTDGVVKTELVNVLPKNYLTQPTRSFRLDMSEFKEKHSVSSIVGSPPVCRL